MFLLFSNRPRMYPFGFIQSVIIRSAASMSICMMMFLSPVLQLSSIMAAEIPRPVQQTIRKDIPLPTPLSHYEMFKPDTSGLPLLIELLKQLDPKELDPKIHQLLLQFSLASGLQTKVRTAELQADLIKLQRMAEATGLSAEKLLPKDQVLVLLKQVDWAPVRPLLLEFFLHQSKVLELIPEKWGSMWTPIVHDAMLYFLDHLSDDRLWDKLVNLAYLPPGTSRGDYLKEFVSKVPSLQKMGQILARNPDLSPDYRKALQDLESGIHTIERDQLVQIISEDIGQTIIDRDQIRFADEILAEASVGAVIRATLVSPGGTKEQQAIFKVVKPNVLVNMPEDIAIIEGLAVHFTVNHDFYKLGSMPLVDIFKELGKALAREIDITHEQQNFISARKYYRNNKKVYIPEIFPISTKHVTAMEFISAEKITLSFPNDKAKRSIMAQRLSEIMTGDVIFSSKSEAIFHGDPHPGNVQHMKSDPKNPYRIALLDWGLLGTFPREDRAALVQLLVGAMLNDSKRLQRNVGALLEKGMPKDAAKVKRINDLIADVIKPKPGRGSFETLEELLFGLIEQGYATKFSLNLFIKSQITIAGELFELDPNLNQDDLLDKQVTAMVKKELPKRFICLAFCWNSRGYRSMLSNGDVWELLRSRKKSKK